MTRRGERPVHLSLIRPTLFGGAEQGMAVLTLIAAVGIPMYGGFHPATIAVGSVLLPITAPHTTSRTSLCFTFRHWRRPPS